MLGTTFQPGRIEEEDRRATRLSPVQQAVQILSLRLPRVIGSVAPLDRSLLTSPRAPHVNAVVESIIQRVLGPQRTAALPPVRRTAGGGELAELVGALPIGVPTPPRIIVEQPGRQTRVVEPPRVVGPAATPDYPGPGFGRPALQQEPPLRSVLSGFSPF